ncbi:MAG: YciI family protein [Burkholderiaceae bacterium]
MLFALMCTDKPDGLEIRLANRPAHIVFLKSLGDALKAAGPFLNDAGDMVGSLLIIESADKSAVSAIADRDPYAMAGLFDVVDIRAWKWVVKNPEAA